MLGAVQWGTGTIPGAVNSRDTSVTAIPTTYTTNSGLLSGLYGATHVSVINGSSSAIGLSLSTQSATCSGGVDNAVIQASGCSTYDDISINTNICARSLTGSAISSGVIYIIAW
jgi:hypothetical protein